MSLEAKDNKFRVGQLVENVGEINRLLQRDFGRYDDGRPNWRVVWSDDQLEKKWMHQTPEGWDLVNPRVYEVKKYPYIKERYVLERLIPVPNNPELTELVSYEPAWTFEDRFRQYLPPRFDACKFVIEAIRSQMEKKGNFTKYKDETNTPEYRKQLLADKERELFGNETPIGDALAHGWGTQGFHENADMKAKKETIQ